MQHVENIIIAAAGRGKRLGLGLPKCLVRVQNRAIIEYQLHLVRHIPHVRLVVGYFEQDVVEFVRRLRRMSCSCATPTSAIPPPCRA